MAQRTLEGLDWPREVRLGAHHEEVRSAEGGDPFRQEGSIHALDQLVAVIVHVRLRRTVCLKTQRAPASPICLRASMEGGRLVAEIMTEALHALAVLGRVLAVAPERDPKPHGRVAQQRDQLGQPGGRVRGRDQGWQVELESDGGGVGDVVAARLARGRAALAPTRAEGVQI